MGISPSSFAVSAQTPTVTVPSEKKKATFDEDISMQFYVANDYSVTVEGVIELTNSSGKDISLTEYGMNLPYFTLKDTKIGYIYPKAFLVDMYSQNNSILFTFKSQYTKPVVIGPKGRITFTFSAQVDKPYHDLGGLRTLSFPFTFNEVGRSLRITVTVDDHAKLIYAPQVSQSLKKKNIFTVSEETGKLFLFSISEKPFSLTLSHTSEVPLPYFGVQTSCSQYLPISCVGCGSLVELTDMKSTVAQRAKSAEKVTVQFTKEIDTVCAQKRFLDFDLNTAKNAQFKAGYVISSSSNQLIPAMWRIAKIGEEEFVRDVTAQGIPYVYADALGYLTIPLKSCLTDDECLKISEKLTPIDTSLTTTIDTESPGIDTSFPNNFTATIKQEGSHFALSIRNNSEKFARLAPVQLVPNTYFTLTDNQNHLLPPKEELLLVLDTKVKIQTSNHDISLQINSGSGKMIIAFKPITITILAVIEVLAYAFIVSLGITAVSVLGIILYNRFNGKTNK